MNQPIHQITRRLLSVVFVSLITLLALSLPVVSRAQSGGPGKDHGVVKNIDDGILEVQGGDDLGTRTYKETDDTQWLGKNGEPIQDGDVVGKYCEVRFRWITDGSEALSVQIESGGGNSRATRNHQAPTSSTADEPIVGRWMFPMDQPYMFQGDGSFSGPNVGGSWKSLGMSDKTSAIQYELSFGGRKEVVTLIRGDREGHEYESGHTLRLGQQMRIKKFADGTEDDFSGSSNSRSTTETRSSHHSSEQPEQTLRGTIGGGEAVFHLKLDDGGSVTGSYSQGGKSYRIAGTWKPGHMSLDEYTGERLTAHLKLTLDDLETTWSGTMYNVYPDKSQYPVSVSKSR